MRVRQFACIVFGLLAGVIHCSSSDQDDPSANEDTSGSSGARPTGSSGGSGQAEDTSGRSGSKGATGSSGSSGGAASGKTSGATGSAGKTSTTGSVGGSGRGDAGYGSGRADGGSTTDASRPDSGGADSRPSDSGAPRDAASPDASQRKVRFVGNITTRGAVRNGFSRYWDQITPENEGKWGSVEPTRGNRNWAALDRIYKYAQDNNIVFKQHTFVWGAQQPSWIATLSPAEQQAAVRDWMRAFCERYPNTKYIDVVNEPPPHTTPSYKNGIGGDGASGWDWIVNSFKWAREACPNAVLILNDYNNIEYADQNQHFINIVNAIKRAGAPIDAVGAQAHGLRNMQLNTIRGLIDKLAATGLPVHITEYDIGEANDSTQARIIQEQFTMFYNHPNVEAITLWGYILGATWVQNTGIQHEDGRMRPAMTWLMDFLDRPTE